MGFLLARPTLYLQALLVLVAVTAGMPGMGSTDDSLVLLDDSDWSQGLLGQAESPAQAEAAAEEAEKEAEKEEGADPKPPQKDPIQKRPAHPADGAVVGNKEQIRAVILATAKKANMQMSPEEQRNFNTNEVDSNTGKIAKGELSNNHLLAAVLESKPVPAPSPPEKKKQAEAQKKALATGTEAKTTEQVYHDLLTKMSKSMPHNMAAVEHKSWLTGSAARLANTETAQNIQSSSLAAKTIASMKKEAAMLAQRAQIKNNVLKVAEEQQSDEQKNKNELANVARRARASEDMKEKTRAAKVDAQLAVQKTAKQYSATWLNLKEVDAGIRKFEAKQTACQVKLDSAQKKAKAALKTSNDLATQAKQTKMKLSEYQAKSNPVPKIVESLQAQVQKANIAATDAKRKAQEMESTRSAVASECGHITQNLMARKSKGKAEKRAVAQLKNQKDLAKLKLANAKEVEESSKLNAGLNKQALQTDVAKAVAVDYVIHIVSATHYCQMKKDAKTGEWSSRPPEFRGTDQEAGNMSNDVKSQCQGKKNCVVKFAEKIEDTGCPQAGFIARYRCNDATQSELELLQLGESQAPSAADTSLQKLDPGVDEDIEAQAQLDKLATSLATVAKKPSKKETLESVQAKLGALQESGSGTEEQEEPGLLEVLSKPKTGDMVKLECKKPKIPKSVGQAMKKLDKAQKAVQQDEKEVKMAVESSVEKAEDQAVKAAKKVDKHKAEVKAASEAASEAENKEADAEARVRDLKEKVKEAKVAGKGKDAKVIAEEGELKEAEEEAHRANAEKKQAENKAERQKADLKEAKEEKDEAEKKTGTPEQAPASVPAGVKAAAKQVEEAKEKIKDESAEVASIKKELVKTQDKQSVIRLSEKLGKAIHKAEIAKQDEEASEKEEEKEEDKAQENNSAAEKQKVAGAKQEEAEAQIKLAELKAKESATTSPNAKAEVASKVKRVEAEVKEAEKVIDQDNQQKEVIKVEQNKAAAEKAAKKVQKSAEQLTENENELAEAKERLAQAKGTEEVMALSSKVHDIVNKIKVDKKQISKDENKETQLLSKQSRQSGVMRKEEGAEDAAIRRSDKLEREIKALKGRIQSSANPDHIPELAKQLAKKEEEKKEADRDVAAAKAKVIVDVKAHHIAKPHPSTPAPPTLPKSAASDPKVMALEAKEAAAAVARKAAAEEARRLTQAKLKQTRQKLEEKVKQDEEAAETATRQTAKVNALIKGLEAQHVLAKARSSRLQKIKENILNGRKWDAGVMSPKDAALKALGPSPERTASQAKEAFARVNSTTPGSATCGNGANCCIQAFADDYCRVEDQKQCTGDATAVGWKPFLTAALPIADAKSITFETRWVKDEKTGLSQEGTILRLRACGEFEAGKGAACFPKEGAGLRFENFFNAPAGACTMAKDIFMVAMAGPFKPRMIKMVAEDKSSNSREAKVDAAAQRQAVKADAETRQKQNLAKGFGSEAGNDLYDLVTQLMETEEGEQLSVSIEPLLTLRGSFQITRK